MPAPSNYLSEGVNQASMARDLTSSDWADVWKDYAVQYSLSQQKFDQDLAMWNMNNEYNSPAAQMARFKEAGLNPNLIYSQGSNGNSASMPSYSMPSVKINPSDQRMKQTSQILDAIGLVSNAAQNISSIIDQGLNVQLKRNQLEQSDIDLAIAKHVFPDANSGVSGVNFAGLTNKLNPLSKTFDPMAYVYFSKNGQLPQFWNNYLTGSASRALTDYKAQYQKYVNENLLPKFNEYQQGKIDIQTLEKYFLNYKKEAMDMLPPEVRGILEPLFEYLGPMFKIIFKHVSH